MSSFCELSSDELMYRVVTIKVYDTLLPSNTLYRGLNAVDLETNAIEDSAAASQRKS